MRLFIIDDDPGLRKSLSLLLSAEGYETAAEGDPEVALERAIAESFDVLLCDLRMPGIDGLEFLRRYRDAGGNALLIMMSAYGGDELALEAVKRGAYDYLPKPFRSDEVLLTIRKAEEREKLRGKVASLEAELARWTDRDLVADSAEMRRVMELASRVAPHPTTVLITGESGTGKEVVARAIHRMSPRRDLRMVAVNCAAIPENLLESELFGHRRGAFTGASVDKPGLFEEADGSTLLLDEVGELPLALQVKLLRVLQEGEVRRVGAQRVQKVDVRVMAATARDLEVEVVEGRFREDLYYRINVVHIHVPPLRDRLEDLEALVNACVARLAARSGQRVSITPDAREAIRNHAWPGNVRELENALERAVVLSADATIRPDVLDLHAPQRPIDGGGARSLKEVAAAAQARAIDAALESAGGSRAEAAKRLGISQRSLFYKLKEYGIS